MATSTMISAFTTGMAGLSDVLGGTLPTAIGLVLGLAGLFMAIKWIISKTQGRRK